MTRQPKCDENQKADNSALKWFIFWATCVGVVSLLITYWALSVLFADGVAISDMRRQILMGVGAISIPLLGSILLKESKISEFRQNWIDGLRESIAEFYANANALGSIDANKAYPREPDQESLTIKAEIFKILMGLDKQMWLIKLRLNPYDRNYDNLMIALKEFKDLTGKIATADATSYFKLVKELKVLESKLLELSQVILKNEWGRVKRGELTFWITKFMLLGMLCGALFFLFKQAIFICLIQFVSGALK